MSNTTTKRNYTTKPITVKSILDKPNFAVSDSDDVLDLREIKIAENIVKRVLLQHPEYADAFLAGIKAAVLPVEGEDA